MKKSLFLYFLMFLVENSLEFQTIAMSWPISSRVVFPFHSFLVTVATISKGLSPMVLSDW